jgi:hypothetical protein
MLQKLYRNDHGASKGEKKYSPAICIGTETNIIHGRLDVREKRRLLKSELLYS